MYNYDHKALNDTLTGVIRRSVPPDVFAWLSEKAGRTDVEAQLNTAFVIVPRKTGRLPVAASGEVLQDIRHIRPGLTIENWSVDRLARVWLLMQLDPANKDEYFRKIEHLFPSAEVNELVALYSALPVLAYPPMWAARCSEGIRSNIGDVLTAIMCNNPYPSENLDEPAWNQLVLKAFFTDKPVEQIIGLDARANRELASILSDYAHERWAAHRIVNPHLWRCVAPFIDEKVLPDIERVASSFNPLEQEAAALAVYHSTYEPAKRLLSPPLRKQIESGELTWTSLAEKTKNYVLQ